MKKFMLVILIIVIAAILYVGGMILYGYATRFTPAPVETAGLTPPHNNTAAPGVVPDTTLSFLIWNIGYGGLGKEVDFFYDGGKTVTSPKQHVLKNNAGIDSFLALQKGVDFILLQEVDKESKRSYKINQANVLAQMLPEHTNAYAVNYNVKFLPFPFTNPMGKILSGIQTFSKYTPIESKRIALPGITDFPRKIFYLQRCLLQQRYKLANGKELVVINAHFEAYDKGGLVKKEQRALTKKILEEEYGKGNYVVLGGDWNIAPPDFNVHTWATDSITDELYLMNNDSVYIEGWKYIADPTTATNRKNATAYEEGKTFKTVIDYFYISPNIEAIEVKGIDMGFNFSDHNPVSLKIKLKE